jgi:hypothetical protein
MMKTVLPALLKQKEFHMTTRTDRCTAVALALACLLLAACKDKHDPLKPTVAQPATVVPIPAGAR